jgi:adenine-specific DNA methylase
MTFNSVLDVFGGSASVSYLFKRMGKQVTYNDYMRWNYIIGLALIENDHVCLSNAEIEDLIAPVTLEDANFVSKTFAGIYFTRQENLWIDAVVSRIKQIRGSYRNRQYKSAVAQYALFQTCLVKRPFNLFHRANLSLRLADVERSFGNKSTWETPFATHFRAFVDEIQEFIITGGQPCHAQNFAASDLPPGNYDLIYLDPPYLKHGAPNETANYWRCYHFLEGLARYSEWPTLINYSHRLRAFSSSTDSIWNDPERNTLAFEGLFEKFPRSTIAISYKKFGAPSIDTLVRLLKRRGKRVKVHTKHYKYALNQQNGCAKLNRECLIIAE